MHAVGKPTAEAPLCPAPLRHEQLIEARVVEDPEDVTGALAVEAMEQGVALRESADDYGRRGA